MRQRCVHVRILTQCIGLNSWAMNGLHGHPTGETKGVRCSTAARRRRLAAERVQQCSHLIDGKRERTEAGFHGAYEDTVANSHQPSVLDKTRSVLCRWLPKFSSAAAPWNATACLRERQRRRP